MATMHEIHKPFDVMDGVLNRCLEGFAPCMVEHKREVIIPGVEVVHHLSNREFGDLGEVKISKAEERITLLYIGDPPNVVVTPEERKAAYGFLKDEYPDWPDKEIVLKAQKRLRLHTRLLDEQRRAHHRQVIQAFFSRMSNDMAMEVGPPRGKTRPAGAQGGTLERAKSARELMKQGVKKTKACKRARIDPRTYDRYEIYLMDEEELDIK